MGSVRTRVSCTIACRGRGFSVHETEAPTRVLEGRIRSRSVLFGPSAAELIQPSDSRCPSTNDLVLCGRTPREPFRPPGLPTSGGSFRPLDRLGLPRRFVHRLSIGLPRFRNRSIPGRPRSETGNERTTLGNVDTRGEIQRLPWFQRGSERMRNRTAWRGGMGPGPVSGLPGWLEPDRSLPSKGNVSISSRNPPGADPSLPLVDPCPAAPGTDLGRKRRLGRGFRTDFVSDPSPTWGRSDLHDVFLPYDRVR